MKLEKPYIAKLRAQDPPTVEDFLARCAAVFQERLNRVLLPWLFEREDIIQSALVIVLSAIREGKLPQSSRGIQNLVSKTFRDLVYWRFYLRRLSMAPAA
jgi:hypothetical protein